MIIRIIMMIIWKNYYISSHVSSQGEKEENLFHKQSFLFLLIYFIYFFFTNSLGKI